MHKIVLIIAAHPDDETLGCGGTIARLIDSGSIVHIAFLADGISSRGDGDEISAIELNARQTAALRACAVLGTNSVSFGSLPDNQMDIIPLLKIAKTIEELLVRFKPDTVFTHHAGDLNIDHRRTHEAVAIACRPHLNNTVKSLLCFEVPSSTEWQLPGSGPAFIPNFYVDISPTLRRKLTASEAYAIELRNWPHPRSEKGIKHLAHWRGASIGVDAAEAFILTRQIM